MSAKKVKVLRYGQAEFLPPGADMPWTGPASKLVDANAAEGIGTELSMDPAWLTGIVRAFQLVQGSGGDDPADIPDNAHCYVRLDIKGWPDYPGMCISHASLRAGAVLLGTAKEVPVNVPIADPPAWTSTAPIGDENDNWGDDPLLGSVLKNAQAGCWLQARNDGDTSGPLYLNDLVPTIYYQTVPDAPSIDSVVATDGAATVTFTPAEDDGASPVTGFTVTASPGGLTASGTEGPLVITGLTNGTAYTFTVVATNAVGDSLPSEASAPATPQKPAGAGGAGGPLPMARPEIQPPILPRLQPILASG